MTRLARILPLVVIASVLATSKVQSQTAPAAEVPVVSATPADLLSAPLVAAPPTPENLVHAAVARWEQANGAGVAAVVLPPLVRETERQSKIAPPGTDIATAVDTAVSGYLSGTVKYRPALKKALAEASPTIEEVIVTGSGPSSLSNPGVNPLVLLAQIFLLTPVPSPWNLRLIADNHASRVSIAGVEGARRADDIYRVSGDRIRVELQTSRGPCRRDVRKSGDKIANCAS